MKTLLSCLAALALFAAIYFGSRPDLSALGALGAGVLAGAAVSLIIAAADAKEKAR